MDRVDVRGLHSLPEFAPAARDRLAADVWDYITGGSGTETTLAGNRAAFGRWALRPRVLVDVSRCDHTTTLLGARIAAPVGVAPMAYHRLVHPDGELATARAAAQVGVPFVVSVLASQRLEDIAAVVGGRCPLWLQLYWLRRRDVLEDLIRRAEAAGYQAIVLTVDTPVVGRRLRDIRHGFAVPSGITAVNVDPSIMAEAHRAPPDDSALRAHSRHQFDPSCGWPDLDWLRARTRLPVLVKGVLTADDAVRAVERGVAGIIVSNHGGRQLDGAVSSLDALADVVPVVDGQCPVLLDGGVRAGTDVLKALALGAAAVFVGRPVLWGLACAGAAGVRRVLRLLVEELADSMVLAGLPRLSEVDRSVLRSGPRGERWHPSDEESISWPTTASWIEPSPF